MKTMKQPFTEKFKELFAKNLAESNAWKADKVDAIFYGLDVLFGSPAQALIGTDCYLDAWNEAKAFFENERAEFERLNH